MEEIKETTYKGTVIRIGNEKRAMLDRMCSLLMQEGFVEISIPTIQYEETFKGKVGVENNNLMYTFKDRGDRNLCLAPEYTAVVQQLAKTVFKYRKDLKLFYVQECFRGEKPQAGRYRQFTQLGVEIINPSKDYNDYLKGLALSLMPGVDATVNDQVKRGLDYYKDGKGFEITCEKLGSSKQVCGRRVRRWHRLCHRDRPNTACPHYSTGSIYWLVLL